MDYLVSLGHSPEAILKYTLRQLRHVLDASAQRIELQTQSLARKP